MTRRRLALLLPLCAACQHVHAHDAMKAADLFRFVRPKVVELVNSKDSKGVEDLRRYARLKDKDFNFDAGFCTGFLVGNGLVMTAQHCVVEGLTEATSGYDIRTADGKRHKPARIVAMDLKRDYALLEVPTVKRYGQLEFAAKTHVGDQVFTFGNAFGAGIAIRQGLVANLMADPDLPDVKIVRFSAPSNPGNSGGPLVNRYGEIVALVFAGEGESETYNLGSTADDLKKAVLAARAPKPREMKIRAEDHRYVRADGELDFLHIPLPSAVYDDPDALRRLGSMKYTVKLPAKMDDFVEQVAQNSNKGALDARKAAVKVAKKAARRKSGRRASPDASWTALVSADRKFLLPQQFDAEYETLQIGAGGALVPRISFIVPPDERGDEDEDDDGDGRPRDFGAVYKILGVGDDSPAGFRAEAISARPAKIEALKLGKSEAFARSSPRRQRIFLDDLAYEPMVLARSALDKPAVGWDAKRQPTADELMKAVAGDGGLASSTEHPLVRAKAEREFKFKALEEKPAKAKVTDEFGRAWTVLHWAMFDRMTIEAYCLPLPSGWSCLTYSTPAKTEAMAAVERKNITDFQLGNMLLAPAFWSVEALLDYQAKGYAAKDPMMRDFELGRAGGDLTVKLKTLGVNYRVPARLGARAMRLTAAVQMAAGGPRFVAQSFEVVGDGAKVCGGGVEPAGTQAVGLLGEGGKAKMTTAPVRLAGGGAATQYGWCVPTKALGKGGTAREIDWAKLGPMAFGLAH